MNTNNFAQKPEDIMPDGVDSVVKNGVALRKGSVLSLLNNAEVLQSPSVTDAEKEKALDNVRALAPGVFASGLYQHVQWKNPEIQHIFDQVAKENKRC